MLEGDESLQWHGDDVLEVWKAIRGDELFAATGRDQVQALRFAIVYGCASDRIV